MSVSRILLNTAKKRSLQTNSGSGIVDDWLELMLKLILISWTSVVFTPEQDNDKTTRQLQDNDKTTTRQMLNLCIAMMPFTPDMSDLV